MGLIRDASVVIAVERQRETVAKLLRRIVSTAGDQRFALSAMGLTEVAHAIYRAQNPRSAPEPRALCRRFSGRHGSGCLLEATALLAGKIDAEQRIKGMNIPFAEQVTGASSLEHGHSIATVNLRHFRLIPDLRVEQV